MEAKYRWTWYLYIFRKVQLANLRSRMQYPKSFLAEILIAFIGNLTGFVAIWILIQRFDSIGGWNLAQMAVLYGLSTAGLGAAQLVFGGLGNIDAMVREGTFDRILIRPLSPLFQVVTSVLPINRVGRLTEGLFVLLFGLVILPNRLALWQMSYLVFTLTCAVFFFGAVMLINGSLSFWLVGRNQSSDFVSYAAAHIGRYPLHVFGSELKNVFTYIIPVAFVLYFPALVVFGRLPSFGHFPQEVAYFCPLLGMLVFLLALVFWRISIRRYQSTGT
jgi:ABC-2 type transport system permease protein